MGTVAALAVDADADAVGAGQDGSVPHADGACVQLCRDMQRCHGVDLVKVDLRVVQKQLGALQDLFCRLDEEIDGAGELIFHLAQDLGSTHIDGAVHIVAAGVHHAGHLAAGRHVLILLNRQRVDIAAEHDRGAVAGLCALQFGVLVDMNTHLSDLGRDLFHFLSDIHHSYIPPCSVRNKQRTKIKQGSNGDQKPTQPTACSTMVLTMAAPMFIIRYLNAHLMYLGKPMPTMARQPIMGPFSGVSRLHRPSPNWKACTAT